MSATEELRALLDERGADWRIEFDGATEWESAAGDYSSAVDVGDGKLVFTGCLTPEQAIAATLGDGECEPKWTLQGETQTQEFWRCDCGNCSYEFGIETRESYPFRMTVGKVDMPNYCPNCGRKVKEAER